MTASKSDQEIQITDDGGYVGSIEQLCNALEEMQSREKRRTQAAILNAARAVIIAGMVK